jgi:hypothetical protein
MRELASAFLWQMTRLSRPSAAVASLVQYLFPAVFGPDKAPKAKTG